MGSTHYGEHLHGLLCLPLVPSHLKDAGIRLRAGSLAPPRAIELAAWPPLHPWCCGGMLQGRILAPPLVALACPLLISAAEERGWQPAAGLAPRQWMQGRKGLRMLEG